MPYINRDGLLLDAQSDPAFTQAQAQIQGNNPMPTPNPLMSGGAPTPPGLPLPQALMGNFPTPQAKGPPPIPQDPDARASLWRNLAGDFIWSLAGGANAAANAPPGQRQVAAFGGALSGPFARKQAEAGLGLTQAHTANLEAAIENMMNMFKIKGEALDLQSKKIDAMMQDFNSKAGLRTTQGNLNTAKAGAIPEQTTAKLRQQGLKLDDSGNVVPIPESEFGPEEAAKIAHTRAQTELADAQAEFNKFRSDPNSVMYRQAADRLAVAQKNAETAAKRLGLSQNQFEANTFGTVGGNAIPGGPTDKEGNPIGLRTAGITGPTKATMTKGQQADVILKEGSKLLDEIDSYQKELGPGAGRLTTFERGLGSDNPAQATLYTHLKSFAALQPALHGARGVKYQKEFEDAIGTTVQNPEALKASIRSLLGTAGSFQEEGTVSKPKTPAKPTRKPATAEDMR